MSMTVSVRIGHLNSGSMGGQSRHDARAEGHVPDYVDQSRSNRNSTLITAPTAGALAKEISQHRRQAGQQDLRKDARLAMSGVITFGTQAQKVVGSMSPKEQDVMFRSIAEAVSKQADRELIELVVHRDESAVHAHFMLREYKYDHETGREMPARLSKSDTRLMQDAAAKPLQSLEITRGKAKEARIEDGESMDAWTHRTVNQLHEMIPADISRAEERKVQAEKEALAAEIRKVKNEQLAEKAKQDFEAGKGDLGKVQKRLEIYERRAAEASADKKRLEAELSGIASSLSEKKQILESLNGEIDRKQEKIKSLDKEWRDLFADKTEPTKPEPKLVVVKTGVFSTENKSVITERDFKNYVRDMSSHIIRIQREVIFAQQRERVAEVRAEKAEHELKKIKQDPTIAAAIRRQENERDAKVRRDPSIPLHGNEPWKKSRSDLDRGPR